MRRRQCDHGWLTGPGPGACRAGCNPPVAPLERPWPDRAAANAVHAALLAVFGVIAAGRTVHRGLIGACEAARALRTAGPVRWYRATGERK